MKLLKIFFMILYFVMGMVAEDKIQHKTGVEARILPLCVVDSSGEPVMDLKKRDLILKVGGKAVDFKILKYDFSGGIKVEERVSKRERQLQERVVFLLFDAMYNSKLGLLRAKDIATRYIKKAGPGNSYVVMSLTGNEGLKYIMGPSKDKEKLCIVINELDISPEIYAPNIFSLVGKDAAAEGMMQNDPEGIKFLMYYQKSREQIYYINNIKSFSDKLGRLRYILKTIELPRTVFLLSEGIARGAFNQRGNKLDGEKKNTALFNLLRGTMRSISATGAMFYTINPQLLNPETERTSLQDSGDRSLQLLALEGGGEYFSGAETSAIVENVTRASRAYYELAFSVKGSNRKKVNVISKRDGLKITTLRGVEAKQSYESMNDTEKQMYAVNVNFNRRWLESKKSAESAVCRYLKTVSVDGKAHNRLEVKIPGKYEKKNADIFVVDFSVKDKADKLNYKKKKLGKTEIVDVPVSRDGNSFFVILDRDTGYAIYGDGAWSSGSWSGEAGDFTFNQSSRLMKTTGGMIDIDESGDKQVVRLNGQTIFTSPGNMRFSKIFKAGLEDAVLLECARSYRMIVIKADGRYGVSAEYSKKPERISDRYGAIHVGNSPVRIDRKGRVEGSLKSFWLFFARFRMDEKFQRGRVIFPSLRNRYDSEGKLKGTVKVPEKDWAFTSFEDSPPYYWETPVVKGNTAYVTLKGEGANVRVVFEKKSGNWHLVRSDSY